MTIRVGDRVRVSPDRAENFRPPFRDWIAEGRIATVTHIIRGGTDFTDHAEISFSAGAQDRTIEAINHLRVSDKPGAKND